MTTEQLLEKLLLQIRKDASAYQWHLAIDKVFAEVAAASPGPSPDLRAQIENMEHQFNQRDFVDGADWLPAGEVLVPLADVLALLTPAPAPQEKPMMDKKSTGLYEKFHVERADGQSVAGAKHDGCDYFVLDLTHDPHAAPALLAYANACRADYPLLAADLDAKWQDLATPRRGRREPYRAPTGN